MKHQPIQISIPQPCSEDWNKMTPQVQGRFCDSCQKCVVDFTGFTDEELYKYFIRNKGKKICGQFTNLQVDRPIFRPNSRRGYFQWLMSLGFIVFLTNLIGIKAKAQEPSQKEWISDKTDSLTRGNSMQNKNEPASKLLSESNKDEGSNGRHVSIDSGMVRLSDGQGTLTLYIIEGVRIINTKEITNFGNGIEFVEPPIHGLPANFSNHNKER